MFLHPPGDAAVTLVGAPRVASERRTKRDLIMLNRVRFNIIVLALASCAVGGYTDLAGAAGPRVVLPIGETEVSDLGKGKFRVRIHLADTMTRKEARLVGLRSAREKAAAGLPELVTVSRTLAGAEYSERVRVISAALVEAEIEEERVFERSGAAFLEMVVRTSTSALSPSAIERAVIGERGKNERIRTLEAEVRRLEGKLAGFSGDGVHDAASVASRRAALEGLLEAESDIRQTFLAGGVATLMDQRAEELEGARRVFDLKVRSLLTAINVDARVVGVEPPRQNIDLEWRGSVNRAAFGDKAIAMTEVSWTLEDGLRTYADTLSRWFYVIGGSARAGHWVSFETFDETSDGVCIQAHHPRNPYRHAAALYDYISSVSVKAEVRFVGNIADVPLAVISPQIAGVVNGGKWWCLFSGNGSSRALPFRAEPGLYERSRGAALSAELPYRVVLARDGGEELSHIATGVIELRDEGR